MLVHAGAGGIGSSTIQIGKAIGAKYILLLEAKEKLEVIRSLVLILLLNYNDATWSKNSPKNMVV